MRLTNVKNSFHIGHFRRTLTAALCSSEKLEAELQHDGDILSALTAALKHAEDAVITARQLCQQLYPVPPPEIKEAMPVPGEVAATEHGMAITIPRLLPARGKDGGYIRATIADLFRDRPRTFLRDVVVAVEQQYDKGLPPRRWRDHDNVELTSLLNELSLWVLSGDDPRTMDLFQFATKTAQNCTVIHIIYRSNFPDWVANVWGKNHKIANHRFYPIRTTHKHPYHGRFSCWSCTDGGEQCHMELSKSYEGAVPCEIHEGSYGYRVLRDVLTCGEMRYTTLRLYANEGVAVKNVQKAIGRLIDKGVLKIVGVGKTKALRYVYNAENNKLVTTLYGEGILDRLMSATNSLHYTTSSRQYQDKKQRRWRMGEVCAMLDSIGCPLWRGGVPPNRLAAYSSVEIRQACGDVNLAANSRIAAELVSEAAAYTVYSIGPTLQRWNREAERRGKRAIELAAMQRGEKHQVSDAICFYSKASIPAEYIRGHGRIKGTVKYKCIGIHNTVDVYRRFHLLPLNAYGKEMLRLLRIPNLWDILCDMFTLTPATYGQMPLVCHGYNSSSAVFFAITGDLNGLYRFLTGYSMGLNKTVVCWDWQQDMIEAFIAEQGFEVTLWDYEPQSLIQEIARRTLLWKK